MKIMTKCGYFPVMDLDEGITGELDTLAKSFGLIFNGAMIDRLESWQPFNVHEGYVLYFAEVSPKRGAFGTVESLENAVARFTHSAYDVLERYSGEKCVDKGD